MRKVAIALLVLIISFVLAFMITAWIFFESGHLKLSNIRTEKNYGIVSFKTRQCT